MDYRLSPPTAGLFRGLGALTGDLTRTDSLLFPPLGLLDSSTAGFLMVDILVLYADGVSTKPRPSSVVSVSSRTHRGCRLRGTHGRGHRREVKKAVKRLLYWVTGVLVRL